MVTSWKKLLAEESQKDYYLRLKAFVDEEYAEGPVYPERKNILHALELTPLKSVRVVILGQDPYHQPGQAHGLAFSVQDGIKIPPSLVNIYKEINREYHCGIPKTGNLESWARQGVLLLNTVLTVREGSPNSHAGQGWEIFTDAVIDAVCHQPQPVVFLLWGRPANSKASRIMDSVRYPGAGPRRILTAAHPNPLSVYRGFEGCDHFLKCNEFLVEHGEKPIQWMIGETAGKKEPKKKETDENEEQYSLFGKGKTKTDSEVPW